MICLFERAAARFALAASIASVLLFCPTASAEEVKNSVGMTLRLLEAGRYERGDDDLGPGFHKDHAEFNTAGDESPRHLVVLTQPFYLAATEVTVGQFRQFVEATSYKTTPEQSPRGSLGWDPKPPPKRDRYVATFRESPEFSWKNPGFEQNDQHPVTGVSYHDAKAYCAWLSKKEGVNYRLPTEAEWEYAARAGKHDNFFSFGNTYKNVIHRHANLGNVELEKAHPDRVRRQWLVDVNKDPADPHVYTAPVASYEASPWGLFDMHGNVWEWCADKYIDTAYSAFNRPGYQQLRKRAIDPLNETPWGDEGEWRVIRGGSWFNSPVQCRAGVRGYFEAREGAAHLGFRVARDASPEQIAKAKARYTASEAARESIAGLVDRLQERRDGRLTIEVGQKRGLLTPEGLKALQTLDEPYDLHLNGQGKLTAEELRGLIESPHLRGLMLSGLGTLTDDDFAGLAKHPELELLQLDGGKLTDKLFVHLAKLDRLELVSINGPGITDAGLLQLPELARLRTLHLHGTASQGLVLKHAAGSPLESFTCQNLSDEGAKLLAGFTTLRDASIGGSSITGPSLAALCKLPRLVRIDLSRCAQLKDADFAALGDAYNLNSVSLDQTAAGDLAAEGLVRLNNLNSLHLGSSQLTDVGLRKLCGILSLHNLQITRDANQVTDDGLVDLWLLVNLQNLTLNAPKITGTGLATVRELPKLRDLNLGAAGLTDAACQNVAGSEHLKQLHLGGWQGAPAALSDAGLRFLAKAEKLEQVNLFRKGTQITDEGVAELRRALPKLKLNVQGP